MAKARKGPSPDPQASTTADRRVDPRLSWVVAAAAFSAAIVVAASFFPAARLWGVNQLAFLPPALRYAAFAILVARLRPAARARRVSHRVGGVRQARSRVEADRRDHRRRDRDRVDRRVLAVPCRDQPARRRAAHRAKLRSRRRRPQLRHHAQRPRHRHRRDHRARHHTPLLRGRQVGQAHHQEGPPRSRHAPVELHPGRRVRVSRADRVAREIAGAPSRACGSSC